MFLISDIKIGVLVISKHKHNVLHTQIYFTDLARFFRSCVQQRWCH